MTASPEKPVPVRSALSQPYWDGLAVGELRLQYCAACGTPRHYPRLLCDRCYDAGVHWKPASGYGRVHSWTVAHHAYHPGFAAELPYTLVTFDLAEGPRALGRWRGGALAIGGTVVARFETFENGVGLVFEPDNH